MGRGYFVVTSMTNGKHAMDIASLLRDFAFSQYETACYLALVSRHPANGSQVARLSGVSRSRIYDVLRGLIKKGIVFEIEKGRYVPLPFQELKKRLRSRFESNISLLEEQLAAMEAESEFDYLLTLRGRREVFAKAADIVDGAARELYLRLFPEAFGRLRRRISKAAGRGVGIRLIAMGDLPQTYDIQVAHPGGEGIRGRLGGESIDIVADRREALAGIFEDGRADLSPIIWTRNRWFVTANRDSLRHDFYHYFLDKIQDRGEALTPEEKAVYAFIKMDD